MARPYSLDLRERVVAAVATGRSCRAVAATYKVSVASVVKWSQRHRKTGSAAARRMGGNRPRSVSDEERGWLLARLAAAPDLTLRHLGEQLAPARGPAAQACHVGLGPGLIDEDQSGWIKPVLMRYPAQASSRHVGTILLGGEQSFF